jgi:hypothetical protein
MNDEPKKEIPEEDKLKTLQDVEERRLEAEKALENAPIPLSKTEKKLWFYHSSEHKAMEEMAANQIRQLGQTIMINLIEQFAEAHGVILGPGQHRFDQQLMAFIAWPEVPKVRMPDPKIPSGAGDK